jgi:hypothetical protein
MALKHLELSEMVGLTATWVGPQRPLLEAIPQLAIWLPRLDEIHARVMKAQPVSFADQEEEIAKIAAHQAALDDRHDDLLRGTSLGLELEQVLCRASDPPRLERAAQCQRALNMLLPRGLLIVNALYVAEAGNAAQTRGLLASEPWLRDLLASIPTSDGGSLLQVVEAWCSLGEQIGLLEEKKAAIQARIANAYQTPRAEILAARNAWLALVNLILGTFPLIEGHQEAIEALRTPVLRTAEIAGKRGSSRGQPRVAVSDSATPTNSATAASPATPCAPVTPGVPVELGLPGAKPFS